MAAVHARDACLWPGRDLRLQHGGAMRRSGLPVSPGRTVRWPCRRNTRSTPKIAGFDRRWHEPSDRFKPVWERRLPFPVLGRRLRRVRPKGPRRAPRGAAAGQVRLHARSPRGCRAHRQRLPQRGRAAAIARSIVMRRHVRRKCAGRGGVAPPRAFAAALPRPLAARAPALRAADPIGEGRTARPPHRPPISPTWRWNCTARNGLRRRCPGHRKAVALEPTQPSGWVLYSFTLQKSGDLAAAVAMMDDVGQTDRRHVALRKNGAN